MYILCFQLTEDLYLCVPWGKYYLNFPYWPIRLKVHNKGLCLPWSLREKCPYSKFFWSVFSRIWTEYGVSLRIQSKCGKIKTRKTPKADTFHALNISRSKGNQATNFGLLIEYSMRNIFLEKSKTKLGGETSPRPFSKKSKLSISLD